MGTSTNAIGSHAEPAQGARRHLDVLPREGGGGSRRHIALRWTVVALAAAAVGLYVVSFFLPWWDLTLYAPQYPDGLRVHINLTGVTGDVREIDILNHYIGMEHLEAAAPVERQYAAWGVGLLGFLLFGATLLAGKRRSWWMLLPAILFPVTFIADSFYWLYTFGHHLDPKAPLHMAVKPFTPQLFGEGHIGQFATWATPDTGFWVACSAILVLLVGVFLRRRVCADCGNAADCKGHCPSLFVGPHAGLARAPKKDG